MRQRVAALVTATFALAAATLAWGSPAVADTPGFAARISQTPGTFTIGRDAKTLSAVVATDRARRCRTVRWALTVSTTGISLDQIKVDRIEGGRSVPIRAQVGADDARIVDVQLDTGQVCRGRNDTGEWRIAFTGPDDGRATFRATALDGAGGEELSSAEVSSRVVTAVAATPTAEPTAEPTATPSESVSPSATFSAEPTEAAAVVPQDVASSADPAALAARNTSGLSVLLPGLIVGAVLVFVGVALLLRLRARNRRRPADWGHEDTQMLPTGFYNLPSK